MVGGVAPIDIVIQYLRFEYLYRRRGQHVIDLIALPAASESVGGPDVGDIWVQRAKRIDQGDRTDGRASVWQPQSGLALEIRYDRIVLARIEVTRHYKGLYVLPAEDTLS